MHINISQRFVRVQCTNAKRPSCGREGHQPVSVNEIVRSVSANYRLVLGGAFYILSIALLDRVIFLKRFLYRPYYIRRDSFYLSRIKGESAANLGSVVTIYQNHIISRFFLIALNTYTNKWIDRQNKSNLSSSIGVSHLRVVLLRFVVLIFVHCIHTYIYIYIYTHTYITVRSLFFVYYYYQLL